MKKIFLYLALCLFCMSCHPKQTESKTNKFIYYPGDYTNQKALSNINIDEIQKMSFQGLSEEQLFEKLGKGYKPMAKTTFVPTYPFLIGRTYYPIDLNIYFRSSKGRAIQHTYGVTYERVATIGLDFFFYQGKVRFYILTEELKDIKNDRLYYSKRTSPALLAQYNRTPKNRDIHYYSSCMNHYYAKVVLKGKVPKNSFQYYLPKKEPCYWDRPGFEEKLRSSGYYEKLKNGYPYMGGI